MAAQFPPCPASLRQIQHYLKTASEHETRDAIVVYWCRLYALQTGLKIDQKSNEAKMLLVTLMDWLEKKKKELSDNEAITNDLAAQAHIENYALKLFLWADNQDQNAIFNKNVVKSFYTAGMLMDVLTVFGELSEDIENKRKYAKWKAAYIHNCLKSGETPVPGPPLGFDGSDDAEVNFDQPGSSFNDSGGNESSGSHFVGGSGVSGFPLTPSVRELPPAPDVLPPDPTESAPTPEQNSTPELLPVGSVTTIPAQPQSSQVFSPSGVKLNPSQVAKAQKYCKWAESALNYDDIPEAISNLQKALGLLTTGKDG